MDSGCSGVIKGMPTSEPVVDRQREWDEPPSAGVPIAERNREFEGFYVAEGDRALRLALLLTSRDDAQEVVQDAFVGLLRVWGSTENPSAYLTRSIVNGSRNVYRRRTAQHDRQSALQRLPKDHEVPTEFLGDLIAGLPSRQREVVVLRFFLQMRDREIADTLGIRTGSVGPTLTRALRRLRRGLSL